MDIVTLLIVGMVLFGGVIGLFLALIFGALLIYNVKNLYPVIRTVALWASQLPNFISLLALGALVLFLIVFFFIAIRNIIGILAIVLLLLPLVLVGTLLGLALLVYVLRIIALLYRIWRMLITGWWGALMPQLRKIQLKHDVGKDKDLKLKIEETRRKLSSEAKQAREKISRMGK